MPHMCGEIPPQPRVSPRGPVAYEAGVTKRATAVYLRYMKKTIDGSGDAPRTAFAKVGLLMASGGRGRKQLSRLAA